MVLLQIIHNLVEETNMFKQKRLFIFVFSSALLGGCGAFFIYNSIFDSLILSIIIGVAVTIFIAGMEVLFVVNWLDTVKYQFLLTCTIEAYEKHRRQSRLKSLLQRLRRVDFR